MEKLVQPYDFECMKMAILKHEETFKQQVYELHRLYQIQRMLMKNMQRSMQNNQETWSLKNGRSPEIEEESEIELTLGPTSYSRRKLKPMASFSSSSTGSSDKSRTTVENSNAEERTRQVDHRSLNQPPWLRQVLI